MLCETASPLGIKVIILNAKNSLAKQVNARNAHIHGSFTDPDKIRELARQCDILTLEIEHVDTHVLEEIAEHGVDVVIDGRMVKRKVEVQPSWRTLRVIQDKYLQKRHLVENGVAAAESVAVDATEETLKNARDKLGYPSMLKARKNSYDGRGNFPVKSHLEINEALGVGCYGREECRRHRLAFLHQCLSYG
jgi:phosphoribosylaminoimidazole carboxylase